MKYQSNKKNIEDFISYKLQNPYESESSRNAFNTHKKYQKILNYSMERIVAKNHEVEFLNMECKKTKEKVWQKILQISNAIKAYEDEKYLYVNKMRQISEDRQKRDTEINNKRRYILNRENQLTEQIETMAEQTVFYFIEKKKDIEEMNKNKVDMRAKMAQYDPFVQKYYGAIIEKETVLGNIDQIRKKIQDQVKVLWEVSQTLESLQNEKKEKLLEREKSEKNEILNRKKQINSFIEAINDCIGAESELQDQEKQKQRIVKITKSIEERKNRYDAIEKGEVQLPISQKDFSNSERFFRITNLMGVSTNTEQSNNEEPTTPLSPNKRSRNIPQPIESINQTFSEEIKRKIGKLQEIQLDIEAQRMRLKEKQDEVEALESQKDKEIQNLSETLQKMKISLQQK